MDKDVLKQLGDTFKGQIDQLEKEIYLLAHKEFNISSPKQLGEVLFEDLGLPNGKKTKTGYSTSVDVLNKLKSESNPNTLGFKILLFLTVCKITA